jgi:hypothetical protein
LLSSLKQAVEAVWVEFGKKISGGKPLLFDLQNISSDVYFLTSLNMRLTVGKVPITRFETFTFRA